MDLTICQFTDAIICPVEYFWKTNWLLEIWWFDMLRKLFIFLIYFTEFLSSGHLVPCLVQEGALQTLLTAHNAAHSHTLSAHLPRWRSSCRTTTTRVDIWSTATWLVQLCHSTSAKRMYVTPYVVNRQAWPTPTASRSAEPTAWRWPPTSRVQTPLQN